MPGPCQSICMAEHGSRKGKEKEGKRKGMTLMITVTVMVMMMSMMMRTERMVVAEPADHTFRSTCELAASTRAVRLQSPLNISTAAAHRHACALIRDVHYCKPAGLSANSPPRLHSSLCHSLACPTAPKHAHACPGADPFSA